MTDIQNLALTSEDIVIVGLVAETKEDATRQLAETLAAAGRVTDLDDFLKDVRAREEQMATGHDVTITKASGDAADGASILSVLALAVGHGEELVLDVEGDNAEVVADEQASQLTSDLDAE